MSDQSDIEDSDLDEDSLPELPKWYRAIIGIVLPFWIFSTFLLLLGKPDWEWLLYVPDRVFQTIAVVGALIMGPAFYQSMRWNAQQNLKKYDPESQDIKNLLKKLRKTGWSFAFLTGAIFCIILVYFSLHPESTSEFVMYFFVGNFDFTDVHKCWSFSLCRQH